MSCSSFAGRGAAFDYSITDNTVTIGQGRNGFATVTVHIDGIALEPDETFQLRLVASSPPPGVFCLDTLDFIIEDTTDGITIICTKICMDVDPSKIIIPPPILTVCYSSLDCHGNTLNVVLPEKADASVFPSECCSAAVRGLSYQSQDGGAGCQNCYSELL